MQMTLEEIKKHWEEAGDQFPRETRTTPTSRDPYLARLELDNILRYLKEDQHALEIGCGDGSHTILYADRVRQLNGVDVAASLVKLASERAQREKVKNIKFEAASVLDIAQSYGKGIFDVVISQRCLINLPNWELQCSALDQVAEVLRDGGLFVLTEGFQDELEELNALRNKLGLSTIQVVPYNHNLRRQPFEEYIARWFEVVSMHDYGAYLVLSRVLHPVAVEPDEPRHDSKLNEAAFRMARVLDLPELDRYSYNRFYALRKRPMA